MQAYLCCEKLFGNTDEGLAAAMSALPAADASLFIREKCRELLVSALDGAKRVS